MKLLLIGYGAMGKLVHQEARQFDFLDVEIFDQKRFNTASLEKAVDDCTVAIEFAHAEKILERVELFARAKKPLLIGTTGWEEEREAAKKIVRQHNSSLLWGSNFSLGVILFQSIVQRAGEIMSEAEHYLPSILELHHKNKKDSPSGTAYRLQELLLPFYTDKKSISNPSGECTLQSLPITAHRSGSFPGTHTVFFDGDNDTIELTHTSRNKIGFARGALLFANWLVGKKGWFTVHDALNDILKKR